jgi:hypothetical protein
MLVVNSCKQEATMTARRYESYLLRLWESDEASQLVWRALLESTDTGERRGFTDLDNLFAYLSTVCRSLPPYDGASGLPRANQTE